MSCVSEIGGQPATRGADNNGVDPKRNILGGQVVDGTDPGSCPVTYWGLSFEYHRGKSPLW